MSAEQLFETCVVSVRPPLAAQRIGFVCSAAAPLTQSVTAAAAGRRQERPASRHEWPLQRRRSLREYRLIG